MGTSKNVVVVVENVGPFECLETDNRLGKPQIVFGGMRTIQVTPDIVLPGQEAVQKMSVPIYHAVYIVPEHLLKDEKAGTITRRAAVMKDPDEDEA